jgi:hypothetical protein
MSRRSALSHAPMLRRCVRTDCCGQDQCDARTKKKQKKLDGVSLHKTNYQ